MSRRLARTGGNAVQNRASRARGRNRGFTLIELTMAMSVFMLVMGYTAEVLVSYFATLDLTHQRTEAMQNAVGVLNEMRAIRDENPDDFPSAILDRFPQDAAIFDTPATLPAARLTSLPGETLSVTYLDRTGQPMDGAPDPGQPLRVRVTSSWKTLKAERSAEASVATVLAPY